MFFPFGEIEDTMSTRGLPLMLFPFGEIEETMKEPEVLHELWAI